MKKLIITTIIIWLIIFWYFYQTQEKNEYTYKKLWIKIFTHKNTNQLEKNKNLIYNKSDKNDYIEVFYKEPSQDLQTEIKETHLSSWCKTNKRMEEEWHPISQQTKWFEVITISTIDGNFAGDETCELDKEFPENNNPISFYMNPNNPSKYYKFSYWECAPWPCSIIKDIQFLD